MTGSLNYRISYLVDILIDLMEEDWMLTIINGYKPTQARVDRYTDQNCRNEFYHLLEELVKEKKRKAREKDIIVIVGDLKSRQQ